MALGNRANRHLPAHYCSPLACGANKNSDALLGNPVSRSARWASIPIFSAWLRVVRAWDCGAVTNSTGTSGESLQTIHIAASAQLVLAPLQRLGVIFCSLLVGACSTENTPPPPAVEFKACTPAKDFAPIPESECTSIAVLENPLAPTGRKIDIHLLRIKSVDAKPQADPLILIQGGPGGSSQRMAYTLNRAFAFVRQTRDLIFVDLRGTGQSNPLNCSGLEAINPQLNDSDALARYKDLMVQCGEEFKDYAGFYTTQYAIADLEFIRTRLGYRQLNLWGASYGSRVALEYASAYPAATRSIILDGVAPRAIMLPSFIPRDAQAAFEKLNLYCQQNSACQNHYGNLADHANTILVALKNAEDTGTPIRITQPDPLNQQPKERVFTPRRFVQLLISALYSRELTSLVPRALSEAAQGNYQLLATINALAEANHEQLSVAEGLYYSVVCNEDRHNQPTQEHNSKTFLGVDIISEKIAVCTHWPKPHDPPLKSKTAQSGIPTLLLSGALDPVTPKIWADEVAKFFPNHQSIEVPGGNHVVSTLGCIPTLTAQFIQSPEKKLPSECSQDIAPLPFYLGADQSAKQPPAHHQPAQDSHD